MWWKGMVKREGMGRCKHLYLVEELHLVNSLIERGDVNVGPDRACDELRCPEYRTPNGMPLFASFRSSIRFLP